MILDIAGIEGLLSVSILSFTRGTFIVLRGPEKGVEIQSIESSIKPKTSHGMKLLPGTIVIVPSISLRR